MTTMRYRALIYILAPVLFVFGPVIAYGAPGDLCHENFSVNPCGILDNPLSAILAPFDAVIPGFGVLLLWGPIVFAIWMTTKSTAITSVVGILISVTVVGLHPQAVGIGLALVVVSFGIMIFQLFPRIKNPI